MTRTASLRQQHDIILKIAILIEDMASAIDSPQSARSVLRELTRLDRLLTAHLSAEDNFLYPEMAQCGDEKAERVATTFMTEMGGLAAIYRAFIGEWNNERRIAADPKGFASEFGAIVHALSNRIHRENTELYPLADTVAEATASPQQHIRQRA